MHRGVNPRRLANRQHITAPILTAYITGRLMTMIPCRDVQEAHLLPIEYTIASSSLPLVFKADNIPLELPPESQLLIGNPQEIPCVCSPSPVISGYFPTCQRRAFSNSILYMRATQPSEC